MAHFGSVKYVIIKDGTGGPRKVRIWGSQGTVLLRNRTKRGLVLVKYIKCTFRKGTSINDVPCFLAFISQKTAFLKVHFMYLVLVPA